MNMKNWKNIKVGDTIKVRTLHFREGYKTFERKVVQIGVFGVGINAWGYKPFWLTPEHDQLLDHIPNMKNK